MTDVSVICPTESKSLLRGLESVIIKCGWTLLSRWYTNRISMLCWLHPDAVVTDYGPLQDAA